MEFIYDDGGRAEAGFKGEVGDCVCRAISIAAQLPYRTVYDGLNEMAKREHKSKRRRGRSSARNGVYKATIKRYIEEALGWEWTPTMQIGSGCQVHLRDGELPSEGPLIVNVSKHTVAVVDGRVHDTFDPTRDGTRCVYGYWRPASSKEDR